MSGVCQRWAPIRASSSHTAEVGLTGAGSQYPVGVASGNLAGRPAGWVTAFRAAGGLALWAGLSRRGCGFGTWAAGPGVRRLNRATGRVCKNKKTLYINRGF